MVRVEELEIDVEAVLVTDPVAAADAADLRYVSDDEPGVARRRCGRGFTYLDAGGSRITDEARRERFRALAIPPAWTDVWICPSENGHIQVTGRDEKGRKQYIYHPHWEAVRNETKFNRLLLFAEALPRIRAQVDEDLRRRGLPRERVLAAVVSLLEKTLIRVGNREYARENDSYGLTTLQPDHVDVSGTKLRFEFRGKSGKEHEIEIRDARIARVVRQCQEIAGHELFQYVDEAGEPRTVESGDVNAYLYAATGENFTAKDFRTWGGTVQAVRAFQEMGPADSERAAEKNTVQAIKVVAEELGNTTAVCRKYYIHPAVLDSYRDGSFFEIAAQVGGNNHVGGELVPEEQLVVAVLRYHLAEKAA